MAMADGAVRSSVPAGYEIADTSRRVVGFLSSTASDSHQPDGIRR